MYKRQIYQIAESNQIEKIDSVARIESTRIETFFARIGMLYCDVDSGRPKEPLIEWELKFSKLESVLWRGYLSMHTA